MSAELTIQSKCSALSHMLTFDEIKHEGLNGCLLCQVFSEAIKTIVPEALSQPHWSWKWRKGAHPPYLSLHKSRIRSDDNSIFVFVPTGLPGDRQCVLDCDDCTSTNKETEGVLGVLPKSRPRPLTTSSDQSFEQACAWLETCRGSHQECSKDTSNGIFVPFRLLDLNASGASSQMQLAEFPRNKINDNLEYACLSHCWGDIAPECMTTSATLAANKAGVRWLDVPKTFREAINVARRLNIRYLWVDSICILQDDSKDWETQAAEMADIFSNAVITIAATTARDHNHGLYSTLEHQYETHELKVQVLEQTHLRVFAQKLLPDWTKRPFGYTDKSPPLLKRAWVYQERLLSRRTLHFDANELIWECMRGGTCQCHGSEICRTSRFSQSNSIDGSAPSNSMDPIMGWWTIIQAFSRLSITFPRDRLPAISGVAKRVWQFKRGDLYAAGLWQQEFPVGLQWAVDSSTLSPRPDEWIAPSWSWACTNRGVDFAWAGAIPTVTYATVSDVTCIPEGEDIMGRLTFGSLKLTAPAIEVSLEYDMDDGKALTDRAKYSISHDDGVIGNFLPDYPLGEEADGRLNPKEPLLCMFLFLALEGTLGYCLILRRPQGQSGLYERVGLLTYRTSKHGNLRASTAAQSSYQTCTII